LSINYARLPYFSPCTAMHLGRKVIGHMIFLHMPTRPPRHRKRGFSLVEVMLAIGIVTFSILACVGLNVASLGALRDASAQDVAGRIFRSLMNEALAVPFENLASLEGVRSYGDDGELSTDGSDRFAVFLTRVEMVDPMLQDTEASRLLGSARNLRVTVYRAGRESPDTMVSTRTLTIGNRSKEL